MRPLRPAAGAGGGAGRAAAPAACWARDGTVDEPARVPERRRGRRCAARSSPAEIRALVGALRLPGRVHVRARVRPAGCAAKAWRSSIARASCCAPWPSALAYTPVPRPDRPHHSRLVTVRARRLDPRSFCCCSSLSPAAARKATMLARVGNRTILRDDFLSAAQLLSNRYPGPPDSAKVHLLRDLVDREVMVQGALHEGLHQDTTLPRLSPPPRGADAARALLRRSGRGRRQGERCRDRRAVALARHRAARA